MDGAAELRQLAHLLRIGAETAREIASIRPMDAEAIDHLADQVIAMADAVEAIVSGPWAGRGTIMPLSTPQP